MFCLRYSLLNLFNIIFEVLVNCGDPGSPYKGRKFGTRYWTGEVVSYICNPGYRLNGPNTRMCLPSGSWSGVQPLCVVGKRHLDKDIGLGYMLYYISFLSHLILSYFILLHFILSHFILLFYFFHGNRWRINKIFGHKSTSVLTDNENTSQTRGSGRYFVSNLYSLTSMEVLHGPNLIIIIIIYSFIVRFLTKIAIKRALPQLRECPRVNRARGGTAKITDFAQTWHKCWVWQVNNCDKI